jgi:hypothetical protein
MCFAECYICNDVKQFWIDGDQCDCPTYFECAPFAGCYCSQARAHREEE